MAAENPTSSGSGGAPHDTPYDPADTPAGAPPGSNPAAPPTRLALLGRFALTASCIYVIWIVLSGRFYPQYLIIGALGSLLIAAGVFPRDGRRPFPVLRFLAFIPWHLGQVLLSNLRVARIALSPLSAIAPRFVRVKPSLQDPRALTVLGCAITLTPGTLTVDVTPDELYVHALDEASARDIEERVMERRVEEMFRA